MRARLLSLEQLMPFATAGELIAHKHQPLVSVTPDTTARAALREMEDSEIAFLPVLEGSKLVGVLSERDIARGVILRERSSVRETTRVHAVAPETKVPEWVTLMHGERIRHLPVTEGDTVQGVLSVRDLMASLIERHERLLGTVHDERAALLSPYPSSY
jgi:CBS domain-containing protein